MSGGDIYDFTNPFPFNDLELGAPVKKGGTYTIRFSINDNPIYLQPPKCFLKSGFTKSGKNTYCDLLFGMENEKFLSWAEQTEKTVISRIHSRRSEWFDVDDTVPTLDDIQSYVQPIGKPYKSGRMYLVRTTLNPAELKVWDENERVVDHEDLCENVRVVTILELKQLSCSATSFQFVFELKQMLLSPERTFDRCLIKPSDAKNLGKDTSKPVPKLVNTMDTLSIHDHDQSQSQYQDQKQTQMQMQTQMQNKDQMQYQEVKVKEQSQDNEPILDKTEKKEKEVVLSNKKPVVEEVEFDLAELEEAETIQLTDPNEVYFKMYKEARRKMKEAKIIALSNYLEAKRIKTTYLADMQLDDDDSGDDNETPKNIDI